MNAIANRANYYARVAQNAADQIAGFESLYLGAKATAPTVDNDGQPLIEGALYFNTTNDTMYVWNGAAWVTVAVFNENTDYQVTGTPTARNLATRGGDVINVRDFGAIGNGTTDDTAAIQAAINSTPNIASDITLIVPKSTSFYNINVNSLNFGLRRILWQVAFETNLGGNIILSNDSQIPNGMIEWGNKAWRSRQSSKDQPVQVIKHNNPLNFFGTEAAFIVQQRDTTNAISGQLIDGSIFKFNSDGDGAVIHFGGDSWATDSFWSGLRVQQEKSKGGTGHCITVNGSLYEVGTIGAYNELGGVQGYLRNRGSTNGYMSGVEIRVDDSIDNTTVNSFHTRMIGCLAGVNKWNAGVSDSRYSHCFYGQSGGNNAVDTGLMLEGPFRDGINFENVTSFSRWAMLLKGGNHFIGWQRGDGNKDLTNCNRIWQYDKALVVQIAGSTAGSNFEVRDNSNNIPFFVSLNNGETTAYKLNIQDGAGLKLNTSYTPSTSGAIGTAGAISWDSNYIYVCTATNTWKRAALTSW